MHRSADPRGALGCGDLVQLAPAPTHLVFALLLVGTPLAGVVVARLTETSAKRPGGRASLVPRVGGTGAVTTYLVRGWPTERVLTFSAVLLTAGTAVALLGVLARSIVLAGLGTVVAVVALGLTALVVQRARQARRS